MPHLDQPSCRKMKKKSQRSAFTTATRKKFESAHGRSAVPLGSGRHSCFFPSLLFLMVILSTHFVFMTPPKELSDGVRGGSQSTNSTSDQCSEHRARLKKAIDPEFLSLSEFMKGDIQPQGSEAVCIYKDDKLSMHFPHAMQQLYSCWSYWQSFPEKKPVLSIVPATGESIVERIRHKIYKWRNRDNPFLKSFWNLLQNKLHVKIRHENHTPIGALPGVPHQGQNDFPCPKWRDGYAVLVDQGHVQSLRDGLLSTAACPSQARIGILNRKENRAILNVESIRQAVKQRFPHSTVEVVYFEEKTFKEQSDFMSKTDILISPHGAQLTGIAFMPNCSQLIELFPDGYLVPSFFGSLARAANIGHYYFYLGDQEKTFEQIQQLMDEDWRRRGRSRNVNLCPAVDQVVDAIRVLHETWQTCCQKVN